MHLHSFRLKNFRRLQDVHIELEQDISIFVGANNSGKTSAAHAIMLFMATSKEKFSIHDFSSECWTALNTLGSLKEKGGPEEEFDKAIACFPVISLDLWFTVSEGDLYRVIDLLPNLEWSGSHVGVRIEFGPIQANDLLNRYLDAKKKAEENSKKDEKGEYHPWPKTLIEYLTDRLTQEFELRYYVLDKASFDDSFRELKDYKPQQLTSDKGRVGASVIGGLLRVDCLGAQRHLSDNSGNRSEDLSRSLSRFYSRNLTKQEEDYTTQKALEDARSKLNEHLIKVFEPTLNHLSNLGYPGLRNPRLLIKSALNPATIMNSHDGTLVQYALDDSKEEYSLPDRYNGLGFKNLIYMVVELLDLHTQWMDIEEDRPPLHLIFIEEPEAHLHTQLQQVFIRKVLDILKIEGEDAKHYHTQLVVTTHSPHILYERGFQPIRYFRRGLKTKIQTSEVLNLSAFYNREEPENRDFLQRYMKLTHCDLFFADAAILVEGNVERLLLPLIIENESEKLKSCCISILEVGGAFGYRFKSIIEFLGITTLVVTDIDSVLPRQITPEKGDEEEDENEGKGSACLVSTPDAETSNQTLLQWLPKKKLITDLLKATDDERTQAPTDKSPAWIMVVYQTPIKCEWNEKSAKITGRTFEESFALENLTWSQEKDRSGLRLRIPKNEELSLNDLSERLYKRVRSSYFDKTDFALALLSENPKDWKPPTYILNGLKWLSSLVLLEKGIDSIADITKTVDHE